MKSFIVAAAFAASALAQTGNANGAGAALATNGAGANGAGANGAQASNGAGVSPYLNSCKAKYTICQSSNSRTCGNELQACYESCSAQWDACNAAPGSNQNTCGLQYVQCVGDNPNDANYIYITEVVPSYTTYCPAPTQFSNNGQLYNVPSAGVVTVTNCPCTVVRTVEITPTGGANGGSGNGGSGSGSGSGSGFGSGSGNGTSTPARYTGAGSTILGAGISSFALLSGVLAYML